MKLGRKLVFFLVERGYYLIFALVIRVFAIRERFPDGTDRFAWPKLRRKSSVALLALGAEGFREDLTCLAAEPTLKIYTIHRKWQHLVTFALYGEAIAREPSINVRHYRAEKLSDPVMFGLKSEARRFYCRFLSFLYKILSVEATLTFNNRYLADLDWSEVSRKFDKKNILLFREIPNIIEDSIELAKNRLRLFGSLQGDHIIVATEATKSCFVDTNFASESEVSVCGVPRMDRLFRLKSVERMRGARPLVVMFWWSITYYDSTDWRRICESALQSFIYLAKNNQHVDFVIKPKPINLRSDALTKGHKLKTEMVTEPKGNLTELPIEEYLNELYPGWNRSRNFDVLPFENAHNLITKATVVCGLHSLTLLESAYAGLPVIVPYFDSFAETDVGKGYAYKRFLPLFDVAHNEPQFQRLILSQVATPLVSAEKQKLRDIVFEREVSPAGGKATTNTVNVIKAVIG